MTVDLLPKIKQVLARLGRSKANGHAAFQDRPVDGSWIGQPSDLFDQSTARTLEVDLDIRPILHPGYHRLRRKTLSSTSLVLPRAQILEPGVARLHLENAPGPRSHLELRLPACAGEHFVGFGERFNAVDQRGQLIENWVDDGAVGFGESLSPLLTRLGVSWNPFPKGPTMAYKPIPWFISSRGYGLLFDTMAPIFFDVAKSEPNLVCCEIAAHAVDVILFYDANPAALVERMTARTGRSPGLPDWALAPWNDAVGGQDAVRRMVDLLRREKIPSSAIWTEDWQGGKWQFSIPSPYTWYEIFPVLRLLSRELYPDFESLAREVHDKGYKFLSYYYPYVTQVDPDYEEAKRKGYFLKNREGKTNEFHVVTDRVGQIDLTNSEAWNWYKRELLRGLELGFDGWMADFGEYTPVDVVPEDGESGIVHHNRYPVIWAKLNHELMQERHPDGDYVFFSRSGGLGQQAFTPVFWTGDSNTDFERWDGLPSNLRGLLSAGLSGMSIWTVDVGGYMSLWTRGRDPETLARWAELAALLTVMRTHHGTHPLRSVQFDATPETLAHYRTCARLHTALFPHLRALVNEACRSGLPVCRPLLLHYPDDAVAWTIEDQFLLGQELLVAPVVERGARQREVYLPYGQDWIDLWSGKRHQGRTHLRIDAPIGKIPLFLRDDAVLATFDTYADTLVRRAQARAPDLKTLDDAERSLALTIGPSFVGPVRLYDGTTLKWAEEKPAGTLPHPDEHKTHELLPPALVGSLRRAGSGFGQNGCIDCGGRWLRIIDSPIERHFTVYFVG